MENAYIYTRVSTLIQVDGFSLEAQEAEIRAFAEARKINIVGKYTDEGKSGKNAEHRPAFTQMMEDIQSDKINCIIVKDYCAIIGLNQKDLENQGILA